jgi:hypothetical protein
LIAGGKNTFQKVGDGVENSTGTKEPSVVVCGGRTTLASTLAWVSEERMPVKTREAKAVGRRFTE